MYRQPHRPLSTTRHSALRPPGHMAGVTLMELIVVITIVGILMGIGVPSYRYITTSYRMAGEINGLLGDMQFARAEAIKEGQSVTVCVSSDGVSCLSGTTTWQKGWIVFPDPTAAKTGGNAQQVLRAQAPFVSGTGGGGIDTFSDGATSAVTFNREGLLTGLPSGGALIPLHDPATHPAWSRCLQISSVGAMFVTQNSSNAACT